MTGSSLSNKYYSNIIPHPELDLWELKILQKIIPKEYNSLIDLGCGTGDFLVIAKDTYNPILGIDINQGAVDTCIKRGIKVLKLNALNTGLKDESYHIVRIQNIIEHIVDTEKLIIESRRILKKPGYLIIHAPTQFSTLYPITNFWDDYTHVRPFTKRGLSRLMSDFDLDVIYCSGYTVGRNIWETYLGKILGKLIPFNWFLIAKYS